MMNTFMFMTNSITEGQGNRDFFYSLNTKLSGVDVLAHKLRSQFVWQVATSTSAQS
jgi:hypothetical protein